MRKGSSTEDWFRKMNNPFHNMKPELPCTLIGSRRIDSNCVWNLVPCVPRAVSSDQIKTLAIGTSIAVGIAVGTTIAMPFAVEGVAALMGAAGAAEIGIDSG